MTVKLLLRSLGTSASTALVGFISVIVVLFLLDALAPDSSPSFGVTAYPSSSYAPSSPSFWSYSSGSRNGGGQGVGGSPREAHTYYSYAAAVGSSSSRELQQDLVLTNDQQPNEIWKASNANLTFGLLNTGSPVFAPVEQGWNHSCQQFGVNCYYVVSNGTCEEPRATLLQEYIDMGLDGIALKPCNDTLMKDLFEQAAAANIPIITFDSDSNNATRQAYIGTDQYFLGQTLARLLRQLRPDGGTFAVLGEKEGRVDGFRNEITKFNNRSGGQSRWYELPPPFDPVALDGDWIEQMSQFAALNPTGMVFMYQTPMRDPGWEQFVDENRFRNITLIGVDAADFQLSYLNRRYVDGLVGQMPYEIGSIALKLLYEYATTGHLDKDFYPTNLVSYNLIPIELAPLTVDQHLLGNLRILGFTCFAMVAAAALGCAVWTHHYRRSVIVQAAQPIFLLMVAGGTLVLASALIPLSFDTDDLQYETTSNSYRIGICMSVPWLAFTGFTVVFAALFSKTWRVTKLFRASGSPFSRGKVGVRDVLAPFAILLTCNFIVLITWTVLDPLMYVRVVNEGTDYWNRVLSTYGACRSDHTVDYLAPLAVINFLVLAIATWQAYRARDIESEFSEAKYIGLAVFSMLQAFLTGLPVVAVVKDMPEAFYVVLTMMIFLLCLAVLVLIFLPKILLHRSYAKLSESEQKRQMLLKVRSSAVGSNSIAFGSQSGSQDLSGHVSGSGPAVNRLPSSNLTESDYDTSAASMRHMTPSSTSSSDPRPASPEQSTEPSRASTASQHRSSLSRVEEAGAENERDHESQDDQVADLERMSESSDVP